MSISDDKEGSMPALVSLKKMNEREKISDMARKQRRFHRHQHETGSRETGK
jgi:hypothetical protein